VLDSSYVPTYIGGPLQVEPLSTEVLSLHFAITSLARRTSHLVVFFVELETNYFALPKWPYAVCVNGNNSLTSLPANIF
jgi:hypothetical protein